MGLTDRGNIRIIIRNSRSGWLYTDCALCLLFSCQHGLIELSLSWQSFKVALLLFTNNRKPMWKDLKTINEIELFFTYFSYIIYPVHSSNPSTWWRVFVTSIFIACFSLAPQDAFCCHPPLLALGCCCCYYHFMQNDSRVAAYTYVE